MLLSYSGLIACECPRQLINMHGEGDGLECTQQGKNLKVELGSRSTLPELKS